LSLLRFERLRRRALPFAEARGYLTESALPIRDKDDRWVFASAVEGRAEVFVTGDRDLLDVAGAAPLKIVDPRGFWQLSRKS
jgi:predicted nucleic acid-binding protein